MNNIANISNGLKNLRFSVTPTYMRLFGAQNAESVPTRPKKPLSPYFRYLGDVRQRVKKENPSVKNTDLMRIIGQQWEKLDEGNKEKYKAAYVRDMSSYTSIIEKYNNSLTDEQRETIRQVKYEKETKKELRDKRRRIKELGKPKRPLNPFLLFLQTKTTPGMSIDQYKENAKKCAEQWKSLSMAQKQPFIKEYEVNTEIYSKTLFKWEDKMLKQGNEDLVRQVTLNANAGKTKKAARSK